MPLNSIRQRILHYLKGKNPVAQDLHIDKKLIACHLPLNPIIIDCGAHIGIDTIELAKLEGSTVFAFEAVPAIYEKLTENTKLYSNIQCFNLALNNIDGEVNIHISSGGSDGSSSLLKPKEHINDHPDVVFHEIQRTRSMKLDTWAASKGINKIDMLWLDMQGAEQIMLEASPQILQTVTVIHTEVSIKETYEGVKTYNYFRKFLIEAGFKVEIEAIPKGFDMGNVLFVKN